MNNNHLEKGRKILKKTKKDKSDERHHIKQFIFQ